MTDFNNTVLNPGLGGDVMRTVYDPATGVKTQAVALAYLDASGIPQLASADLGVPVTSEDFRIAQGLITGKERFRKFGANSSIAATETFIALVGGTAPYMPTTAVTVEAVSADGTDTAAGVGAQQITVVGVDQNWNEASEVLTLAGATPSAASTTTFLRIYRAYVSRVGTYRGTNVGLLTIRVSSGGTSFLQIGAGKGQTQGSHYTVPAGKTLYIKDVHVTVNSTKAVNLVFWQAPNANDVTTPFTGAKRIIQEYTGLTGAHDFEYLPQIVYGEYTDLWFSGTASAGGGGASIEYNGILVTN